VSLPVFSTELLPDSRLRALVLACGAGCGTLGLIVIATLPWPACLRALLGILWWAAMGHELGVHLTSYARVRALGLDDAGNARLHVRDDGWQPATVAAGSVVLTGVAWLRIRAADGRVCAELLAGNCRENGNWRRLQVIWRHLGVPP